MATTTTKVIDLQRITRSTIKVPIVGVTPLIPHNWSEKARQARQGEARLGMARRG